MLRLVKRAQPTGPVRTSVTLTLENRIKSRQRVTLDDGCEAGVFLERGKHLRDGDHLATAEGILVLVRAAPEPVSEVRCANDLLLARACYHLGNRHVPLQIEPGLLRYQRDHVLDDMLRGLGLTVVFAESPFEPEAGAYDGDNGGHVHGHDPQ